MWCWLQPFGQPDILMWIRLRQRVVDVHRLDALLDRRLRPIELVMPSLQESVPGQRDDVGDLVGAGVAEAELAERAARRRRRASSRTQRSTRFWCTVVRA